MRVLTILLCSLLALSACGKKGDPEPLQPDQFPRQYPTEEPIPETGKNLSPPPAPSTQRQPLYDPLQPRSP